MGLKISSFISTLRLIPPGAATTSESGLDISGAFTAPCDVISVGSGEGELTSDSNAAEQAVKNNAAKRPRFITSRFLITGLVYLRLHSLLWTSLQCRAVLVDTYQCGWTNLWSRQTVLYEVFRSQGNQFILFLIAPLCLVR